MKPASGERGQTFKSALGVTYLMAEFSPKYEAYAGSEEEAREIVADMVEHNGWPEAATFRQLPYAPTLWAITVGCKSLGIEVEGE